MEEKFTQPVPTPATTLPQLPRYRSHKIVRAARIAHVAEDGALILDREDGTDQFVRVMGPEWIQRHLPKAGGFLVEYADGYTSYSPGPAFEDGYTRLAEIEEADPVGRELGGHKVNEANDQLRITVADGRGPGGANHRYVITGFDASSNPSHREPEGRFRKVILFQCGPIKEVGVNGITHEALLAILMDRLEGFQRGPFACDENAQALHFLRAAQKVLHKRTSQRIERDVEGTHEV